MHLEIPEVSAQVPRGAPAGEEGTSKLQWQPVLTGPEAAAGLRSLQFLPLMVDMGAAASSLPKATEADVEKAVQRYSDFHQLGDPAGKEVDYVYDTVSRESSLDKASRKSEQTQKRKYQAEVRQLRAYLHVVVKAGAPLTWDIFVPHAGLWHDFSFKFFLCFESADQDLRTRYRGKRV